MEPGTGVPRGLSVLYGSDYEKSWKLSTWVLWALAVITIIVSGVGYRVLANRFKLINVPIKLPVPLSAFPIQIGNWVGSELTIPATTREYMEENFADDFFSRRYVNSAEGIWADVYMVYCSSRPSGILGHRPGVCYPANGWQHQNTERSQLVSKAGLQVDCLVERFRKNTLALDEVVVMSFYVRNGRITADEGDLSGVFGRIFNIARDPSRYVAQVQISSVLESSVRKAAHDIIDRAVDFLPDENGKIRAAGFIQHSGVNVKSTE
ncbi:MAG: exosortase-associated EpsI family protein [Sedimentisphaerales bacterium]